MRIAFSSTLYSILQTHRLFQDLQLYYHMYIDTESHLLQLSCITTLDASDNFDSLRPKELIFPKSILFSPIW